MTSLPQPDLANAIVERLLQFGVLSLDQDPALVLVGWVKKRQVDSIDHSGDRRTAKGLSIPFTH